MITTAPTLREGALLDVANDVILTEHQTSNTFDSRVSFAPWTPKDRYLSILLRRIAAGYFPELSGAFSVGWTESFELVRRYLLTYFDGAAAGTIEDRLLTPPNGRLLLATSSARQDPNIPMLSWNVGGFFDRRTRVFGFVDAGGDSDQLGDFLILVWRIVHELCHAAVGCENCRAFCRHCEKWGARMRGAADQIEPYAGGMARFIRRDAARHVTRRAPAHGPARNHDKAAIASSSSGRLFVDGVELGRWIAEWSCRNFLLTIPERRG